MKVSFLHTLFAVGGSLLLAAGSAFAQIPTFASADLVLGQTDFTSGGNAAASLTTLDSPRDVVVDPASGKVFVSDGNNHRVLRYASMASLLNGAPAEVTFGQSDDTGFAPNNGAGFGNASQTGLALPSGLSIDSSGRLWVADAGNNRVVMYANAADPALNLFSLPPANLVFGQNDFDSSTASPGFDRMSAPLDVFVDAGGDLWVAEAGNNRVLRFRNASTNVNGANANQVFGQPTIVGTASGSGAGELNGPAGVTLDASGTLWVSDTGNQRVTGFVGAGTQAGNGGTDASVVLGQANFMTTTSGIGDSKLSNPTGLQVDAFGALWVVDSGNNRVLRFDGVAGKSSGAAADAVIGQADFSGQGNAVAANRLNTGFPSGLYLEPSGDLWVADGTSNRVLRFSRPAAPAPVPAPVVDVTRPELKVRGRKTIETLRKRVVIRGTATDDVSGIDELEIKARGAKVAKNKVRGNGSFKVVLRIKKTSGRVIVKLRAVDEAGNKSKRSKVRILRR